MKNFILLAAAVFSFFTVSAQYPLVDIYDLQYRDDASLAVEDDLSNYNGDTVRVQGVVSFNPCDYALSSTGSRMGTFLQDEDGGPFTGIHVLIDWPAIGWTDLESLNDATLFVDNFQVGNIVECTGIINSFEGYTQLLLLPIESEIIGFSTMPTPTAAEISELMMSDGAGGQVINTLEGEKYEGMYVEFTGVYVTDITPSGLRWFWYVQDVDGNKIQIRDMSGHFRNDTYDDECNIWAGGAAGETNTPDAYTPPALGTNLAYIRGVIVEFTAETEYAIAPLSISDIGPALASPPVITDITRTPVVATSTETVSVSATITDLDGTVAYADLYYSYGIGNTGFTAVSMSDLAGDTWQGNIPGPGVDSTYVNFYISATDNDGNTINYPSPSSPIIYIVYDDGITSIVQIQNSPFSTGVSIWANDSIASMNIQAIVTSTTQTYDLGTVAIQEGSQAYEGIFIKSGPGDGTDVLFRGDEITITSAKIIEEFGVTKLANITYTLNSQMNALPAFVTGLDPLDVDAKIYDATEPYEGMLVKFDNAYVTSNNADEATGGAFGEWRVNLSNTPEVGMRCDDYSYELPFEFGPDTLTMGEELTYIQGIMYFSFGNWKLLPRDKNDIEGYHTTYPNSIVSFNFTSPIATGIIDQTAGTIELVVPEGTDVTSLVPTIDITGQYVDPASGVAQNFSSPVTYTSYSPVNFTPKSYEVTVTFQSGIEMQNLSEIQVYPNPTSDYLTVEIDASTAMQVSLEIKDLEGRNVLTINELCTVGKNSFGFDLRALANGLYLLQISNTEKSVSRKIEVSK
ncbi:MAG: T9SS type A sorting domain-containing protein [Bacteroidetes bacterium]|nr:T9SS type A sorting domain-containing protein [Bacteroidota bacterium]